MSGFCKQEVIVVCNAVETPLTGYVTDSRMVQADGHPYFVESYKVRLPFMGNSIHAESAIIDGKSYQVMAAIGYPSADRTVLEISRASLQHCDIIEMSVHQLCEVLDGPSPALDTETESTTTEVLLWHEHSKVVDAYDTRGFDQTWRLYVTQDIAKSLTGLSYFLSGETQYKVREVYNLGRQSHLPYASCEVNRWGLA